MPQLISTASGIVFLVAFAPYVIAILKGQTKPAKASWIIWATLDLIALAGMAAKHAVNGQIIGAVTGAALVAVLSVRYGTSGWTRLDKLCFAGAGVSVALWWVSGNADYAIAMSLIALLIGAIPTVTAAWKNPAHEDKLAWTLFWVSCVLALVAVPRWTLADAGQPITFTIIETAMVFIVYVRPRMVALA